VHLEVVLEIAEALRADPPAGLNLLVEGPDEPNHLLGGGRHRTSHDDTPELHATIPPEGKYSRIPE